MFDRMDLPRGILHQALRGARFSGKLPELARFINGHLATDSKLLLMGGEILPDQPHASFEVQDGWTVERTLLEFARVSGASVAFNLQEYTIPERGSVQTQGGVWGGGFLNYLVDWREPPDWTLALM